MVRYEENSIVITIPTAAPSVTHRNLMLSLLHAARAIGNMEGQHEDSDLAIQELMELNKELLPNDIELERALGLH